MAEDGLASFINKLTALTRHVEGIKQHCNERSPVLYSVLQATPTNCSEYKHHNTPKEKYTL